MNRIKQITVRRMRRDARARAKIFGVSEKPRLTVFRSNAHLYAQLIDDAAGHTLASGSTKEITDKKLKKSEKAEAVGAILAKRAIDAKITTAVFDKGSYKFHGRIKALAEGARKSGLTI